MKKLVFEIDDQLKGELENLAKRDARSLASYVRLILQAHVDQVQRGVAPSRERA